MKKLSLVSVLCCMYLNCTSAYSFDAAYSDNIYNGSSTNALWIQYNGIQYSKNEVYLKQLESGKKLVYVVYP